MSGDHNDDLLLIERSKSGDGGAFRQLVERYHQRLYGLVASMVTDRSEAEDVLQDVFFKVHRKLHLFEGKSAFYTWIYRVALNTATDHLKRRRNREAASLEDLPGFDVHSDDDGPDRGLDRGELRTRLAEAISELPDIYRNILVLREYEELSYEEIAATLECSKGTVESRLFRARARLRDKLGAFLK